MFRPQLVDSAAGSVVEQILLLGVLFVRVASCTDCLDALLGSTVGQWLARNASVRQIRRYVADTMCIGLGLTAAIADFPDKS